MSVPTLTGPAPAPAAAGPVRVGGTDAHVVLAPRGGREEAHRELLRLLTSITGRAFEPAAYRHDAQGRPHVRGADGLDVSVSHTRGALAVAVGLRGRIGVDVETPRRVAALDIASAHFAAVECAWLRACPADERDRRFRTLWTRKEAVAKALGCGLTPAVLALDLRPDVATPDEDLRAVGDAGHLRLRPLGRRFGGPAGRLWVGGALEHAGPAVAIALLLPETVRQPLLAIERRG